MYCNFLYGNENVIGLNSHVYHGYDVICKYDVIYFAFASFIRAQIITCQRKEDFMAY